LKNSLYRERFFIQLMLSWPLPYFDPSSIPVWAKAGRANNKDIVANKIVLRAFVFILFKDMLF
jgi:hypothetical protein